LEANTVEEIITLIKITGSFISAVIVIYTSIVLFHINNIQITLNKIKDILDKIQRQI